jgi:hypothetical protein
MSAIKVVQIWQHNKTKIQIRVLEIVNKIVVAEILPSKTPMFLTSVNLEQNYQMVRVERDF